MPQTKLIDNKSTTSCYKSKLYFVRKPNPWLEKKEELTEKGDVKRCDSINSKDNWLQRHVLINFLAIS